MVTATVKDDDSDFEPDSSNQGPPTFISRIRVGLRKRGNDGTAFSEKKGTMGLKFQLGWSLITLLTRIPTAFDDRRGSFVTLRARSKLFQQVILRKKPKRKILRPRRLKPYTNSYRFEFGEDRLSHYKSPSLHEIDTVAKILEKERPKFVKLAAEAGTSTTAMHTGKGITIDSIVRVIISQSCTNELALDAQQTMIRAYPFKVEGKLVFGTKPNYHSMREQNVEKLQVVLKKAGLQILKAKAIKACLDMVHAINVSRLAPGEVACEGNQPGAVDFVPGLLSMDYLNETYEQGGKQALFDKLVQLPQIGVKSACCLMGFNMALPVFAVDTHVAAMAKLLRWVPEDCDVENDMCSHLDSIMPDNEQKVLLHQDFWRHRRNCDRCSGRTKPHTFAYQNTICPLEHLVTRPAPPEKERDRTESDSDDGSPTKSPAAPKKPAVKKELSEAQQLAKGLVRVTYQLDDDFDAAGGGGPTRTTWIQDFSLLEFTAEPKKETIEDDSIYEEMVISTTIIKKRKEE